ncbi:MAG TPA: hypothetical protein DCP63_12250 [Bacteroidetes bacterium]|nr:hypothetical protein [Bacteroidota bacterium]
MKMRTAGSYLILLCFWAATAWPQNFVSDVSKKGTSAASFLSIGQGARASAMGSAFVAVADDPSAIYWNPAGLAGLSGAGVMFDHTQWIAGTKYNFVAGTYGLGDWGTIGLSFTSSALGEMNVTTIDEPAGTGETFTASDVAVSVGYALQLTDNFSIGFNPKYVSQTIWKMNADAFAVDLGVQYRTPFPGITLAMSISNFGSKMRLLGNSTLVLYDLDTESSGNNERIPAHLETDEWALPLNFRVGLAYRPAIGDQHKVVLAIDAAHPSDNYESLNIGGEYTFDDLIAVRGGYKALFLQNSEESFTVGFGVKQLLIGNIGIQADYAFSDFGRLKSVQKVALSIHF